MFDTDLALEALGALLNANVTSTPGWVAGQQGATGGSCRGAARQNLHIRNFIPTLLGADEISPLSTYHFKKLINHLQGGQLHDIVIPEDIQTGKNHIINKAEFFDPAFNYDFTKLKDTETYYRGGEVYERPCGWYRYGLKVLNKYDGNTWLGATYRSTQSVPGEWPVSFHGTSKKGAEGIIEGYYKPGPRQAYGRGIYSTPYVAEAIYYAKTFTSSKTGKTYQVILQNRINPQYRLKYNDDKYWLIPVPAGISDEQEKVMVERAIRPYGLLLKEV